VRQIDSLFLVSVKQGPRGQAARAVSSVTNQIGGMT
jgi:hypothetical protein